MQVAKVAELEEAIAAAAPPKFSLFSAPVGMILVNASRAAVTDTPLYNHGGVSAGLLVETPAAKKCRFGDIAPPKARLAACLDLVLRDEPLLVGPGETHDPTREFGISDVRAAGPRLRGPSLARGSVRGGRGSHAPPPA